MQHYWCCYYPRRQYKNLSVYVCSNLSWSKNVLSIIIKNTLHTPFAFLILTVKEANGVCYVMLHAFANHNITLYMSAFNCYVEPILDYCCCGYNTVLCRDLDAIEIFQHAFTRCAFCKSGIIKMCCAVGLKYIKVHIAEYLRFLSCLTLFYNVHNKHVISKV